MAEVYLVTSGDHEDYDIHGVYSTRELAEEAKSILDADNIETRQLDELPKSLAPKGKHLFCVEVESDGVQSGRFPDDMIKPDDYDHGDGTATYWVYAKDAEQAEKMATKKHKQRTER